MVSTLEELTSHKQWLLKQRRTNLRKPLRTCPRRWMRQPADANSYAPTGCTIHTESDQLTEYENQDEIKTEVCNCLGYFFYYYLMIIVTMLLNDIIDICFVENKKKKLLANCLQSQLGTTPVTTLGIPLDSIIRT